MTRAGMAFWLDLIRVYVVVGVNDPLGLQPRTQFGETCTRSHRCRVVVRFVSKFKNRILQFDRRGDRVRVLVFRSISFEFAPNQLAEFIGLEAKRSEDQACTRRDPHLSSHRLHSNDLRQSPYRARQLSVFVTMNLYRVPRETGKRWCAQELGTRTRRIFEQVRASRRIITLRLVCWD